MIAAHVWAAVGREEIYDKMLREANVSSRLSTC
jgi:hypothetical protein